MKNKEKLSITLSQELIDKIKNKSKEQGLSVSSFIEITMRSYFSKKKE